MGITIIGGLFTSTALTLIAVPVLYTLFDDLSIFVRRVNGWFSRSPSGADQLLENLPHSDRTPGS